MHYFQPPKSNQTAYLRSLGLSADALKLAGCKWLTDRWLIPSGSPLVHTLKASPMPAPSIGEPCGYDIMNAILDAGGIRPIRQRDRDQRAGEWDDMPDLRGVHRSILCPFGMSPDSMASSLQSEGYGDGTASVLWHLVACAIERRRKHALAMKRVAA